MSPPTDLKHRLLPVTPAKPDVAATDITATPVPHTVSMGAPRTLVIDVRSEREFQNTAVENALNVPLPQLANRIGKLANDKATPLVLYCASGARSSIGCGVLRQLGYTEVTNAGGLYAAAERLKSEVRR